jgi:hypothetical protein
VRQAAEAAFARRDPGVPVLDLTLDSLLDEPGAEARPVRRLQFAGHGVTLDLRVSGTTTLSLDLHVEPEAMVEIDVRQAEPTGEVQVRRRGLAPLRDVPPGLTSLLLRWRGGEQVMRTAWVRL